VPNLDVIGKDWDVPESAIEIVIDHPSIAELPYWKHMATLGVPPHVTLLYPWLPAPIDAASLDALRAVARQFDPFSISLARVETFPKGVVYASAEPDGLLRSMIRALTETFPDTPPFGGEFAGIGPTPHCTLAKCDPGELEAQQRDFSERLDPVLPMTMNVTAICVEEESESGLWSVTSTIPLGPVAATP
jgi:2'-5' RNA ligase